MATQANNSAIWTDDDESNFISLDRDEKFGSSNLKRNVFVHNPHSHNDYEIHRLFDDFSGSKSKSVSLSDSVSVLSLSPSPSDENIVMDMEDVNYYDYMEDMMDVSSASSRASEIFRPTARTNEDIVDVNVNNAASNSSDSDIFSLTTTKSNEHLVVPQFRLKKDPYLEAVLVRLPLDTQPPNETSYDKVDDITENFNDLSTKHKLKLNILRKRIAEGKDIDEILHQCPESSKIDVMPSEEEKAKEHKRKERNRLSAKRSRELKKEEYDTIKRKHKVLVQVNEDQKKDIEDLEKTVKFLEEYIHTQNLETFVEKTALPPEDLFNTYKLQPLVERTATLPEEFINTHNLHPHINQESVSEPTLETDYPTSHCPVENINSYSGQDISLNENESLNNKVLLETLLQYYPEFRQDLQASSQFSENPLADSMEFDSCTETNSYQVQVMDNTLQRGEGIFYNQNDWCGETTEQYNTPPALVSPSEHCVTGPDTQSTMMSVYEQCNSRPAMLSTLGQSGTHPTMVSAYEQCNTGSAALLRYQYSNTQPDTLSSQQQCDTQPHALLSSKQQCDTQPPALRSSKQQCDTQPSVLLPSQQQRCTQPPGLLSLQQQCDTQPPALLSSKQQCDTQPSVLLSSQQQCYTQPPALLSSKQQCDTQPPAPLPTCVQFYTHEQSNNQPALWSMHATGRTMSDSLKQNPKFPITSSQLSFEPVHGNAMLKTDSCTQQEYTERGTAYNSNDNNQVKIMACKSTKKVLDAWLVEFSSSSDDELTSLTNSFIEGPIVKKRKFDGDDDEAKLV